MQLHDDKILFKQQGVSKIQQTREVSAWLWQD
jgi:hypothetical protein